MVRVTLGRLGTMRSLARGGRCASALPGFSGTPKGDTQERHGTAAEDTCFAPKLRL